jgi:hypothetical protein
VFCHPWFEDAGEGQWRRRSADTARVVEHGRGDEALICWCEEREPWERRADEHEEVRESERVSMFGGVASWLEALSMRVWACQP